MRTLNRLLIIFALLISGTGILAQNSWKYISPKPGAKYINPVNTIAFRHGDLLDPGSIRRELITVYSSSKGEISGSFELSRDMRTLIFYPDEKYNLTDRIHVSLGKGIRTMTGLELEGVDFAFTVKEVDNLQMLTDFYESQAEERNMIQDNVSDPTWKNISFGSRDVKEQEYPEGFPTPVVTEFNNPSPGYVFAGPRPSGEAPYDPYLMIVDRYGVPVFYRKWTRRVNDFKVLVNNQLTYSEFDNSNPSVNKYFLLNSHFEIIDTLQMGNGYVIDQHDVLMEENGDHFLMAYDPQIVDMSTVYPGGDTAATVVGFIVQKLDADHNVIFQWRSWDYFDILDANNIDFTKASIDYVHGNAFEIDTDSNLLISCRHMDEITKINLETGDIIWRFGVHAKNNMFNIANDTTGFTYQHDIRRIPNGNITVYDNGNHHTPPHSQALEYYLDEENFTAELVWGYIHDPVIYGRATGSHRRLASDNSLIGWGFTWPVHATEVTLDGTLAWELNSPEEVWQYRMLKFDWVSDCFTTNVDTIDYGEYDDYIPWPRIFSVNNNSDVDIQITSTQNHWDSYYVSTPLPLTVPANGSANMTVYFYPTMAGQINDVLTLNYESMYQDSLPQCISRQIVLMGSVPDAVQPVVSLLPEDGSTEVSRLVTPGIAFDEPVVKNGGGVLTRNDLKGIIVFKEGDASGEDVPFSAYINAWKTEIQITPDDTLKPLTTYYLELKANVVQDNAGNVVSSAQIASWTTEIDQGIAEPDQHQVNVFPNPAGDITYLQFAEEKPQHIKIVNIRGELIMSMDTPVDNILEVDLFNLPAGIYLVQMFYEDSARPQYLKIIKN